MAEKEKPPEEAEEYTSVKSSASPAEGQCEEVSRETRQWAMFCHLAGLAWMVCWMAPVVGGVIGTLIIWQIKKDDHPYLDAHGKRAFNFQLSMLIYAAGLCVTVIGIFLLPVVAVLDVVFTLIAAIRANNGRDYSYPLSIEFVK